MMETYLAVLETGYYEMQCAFEGLMDENVWKRPAEGLPSVGEIAGHLAYWEAVMLAGEGGAEPDLAKCPVNSPLIDPRFGSLSTSINTSLSAEHLAMTAEQVSQEMLRVHKESVGHFKALNPRLDDPALGWSPRQTYSWLLEYAAFHVSYHAGQVFWARHLLGEKTPDN
jgi:DinB superfamily